jgi:hypothetical protein
MGYHEGGVELVLPILVKVIFLYNSSLSIGYSSFPMDHFITGSSGSQGFMCFLFVLFIGPYQALMNYSTIVCFSVPLACGYSPYRLIIPRYFHLSRGPRVSYGGVSVVCIGGAGVVPSLL